MATNPNETYVVQNPIKPEDTKYLTFEGGGGKGIVYLGAVRALEEVYKSLNKKASIKNFKASVDDNTNTNFNFNITNPLSNGNSTTSLYISNDIFPLNHPLINPVDKPIKGISGASAGAITAFMLAIGMTSKDIETEAKKTTTMTVNGKKDVTVNSFETFLEGPDYNHKIVVGNERKKEWTNLKSPDTAISHIKTILLELGIVFQSEVKSYLGNRFLDKIKGILNIGDVENETYSIAEEQIVSFSHLPKFLYNLLFTRGFFSGLKSRDYFAKLIKTYLIDRLQTWNHINTENSSIPAGIRASGNAYFVQADLDKLNPHTLTFKELFKFTGIDLVISGVNITRKRPLYFSVTQTPDFPVIEAVQISMNIPGVFRPIWVNFPVDSQNKNKTIRYNGFWMDGGTLNNYPIHAFDYRVLRKIMYQKKEISTYVATELTSYGNLKNDFLGFRLSSNTEITKTLDKRILKMSDNEPLIEDKLYSNHTKKQVEDSRPMIYDNSNTFAGTNYLTQVLDTLLYPSEDGQIKTKGEKDHTLELECGNIGTTDFSTPNLDDERLGKKDGKGKKVSKIGKEKRERTKVAYIRTLAKFGISKSSAELNYINFYE